MRISDWSSDVCSSDLIEERRAAGGGDGNDIISTALSWEIDGEPVKQEDLLSCLLLLFMAGLDTVAAQLSYGMHHLATNPADRERLLADPSLMPSAVEEVLRTFPIVQTARKVTTDTHFRSEEHTSELQSLMRT